MKPLSNNFLFIFVVSYLPASSLSLDEARTTHTITHTNPEATKEKMKKKKEMTFFHRSYTRHAGMYGWAEKGRQVWEKEGYTPKGDMSLHSTHPNQDTQVNTH